MLLTTVTKNTLHFHNCATVPQQTPDSPSQAFHCVEPSRLQAILPSTGTKPISVWHTLSELACTKLKAKQQQMGTPQHMLVHELPHDHQTAGAEMACNCGTLRPCCDSEGQTLSWPQSWTVEPPRITEPCFWAIWMCYGLQEWRTISEHSSPMK